MKIKYKLYPYNDQERALKKITALKCDLKGQRPVSQRRCLSWTRNALTSASGNYSLLLADLSLRGNANWQQNILNMCIMFT